MISTRGAEEEVSRRRRSSPLLFGLNTMNPIKLLQVSTLLFGGGFKYKYWGNYSTHSRIMTPTKKPIDECVFLAGLPGPLERGDDKSRSQWVNYYYYVFVVEGDQNQTMGQHPDYGRDIMKDSFPELCVPSRQIGESRMMCVRGSS